MYVVIIDCMFKWRKLVGGSEHMAEPVSFTVWGGVARLFPRESPVLVPLSLAA